MWVNSTGSLHLRFCSAELNQFWYQVVLLRSTLVLFTSWIDYHPTPTFRLVPGQEVEVRGVCWVLDSGPVFSSREVDAVVLVPHEPTASLSLTSLLVIGACF